MNTAETTPTYADFETAMQVGVSEIDGVLPQWQYIRTDISLAREYAVTKGDFKGIMTQLFNEFGIPEVLHFEFTQDISIEDVLNKLKAVTL